MMNVENALRRIEEIKQEREAQLAEIDAKIKACESVTSGIDAKIDAAAAAEDLEAWNKANFEKSSAAAKIKMLQQKRKQVEAFDFVKQEETDDVINGLIERENELDALISSVILKANEKIKAAYETYKSEIDKATDTVDTWIKDIRPYRGIEYASKFSMQTRYNSSAGKDITRQIYDSGRYTGNWTTAAFIARDFTERIEAAASDLEIAASAPISKPAADAFKAATGTLATTGDK